MKKWAWPVLGIVFAVFFLVDPEPRHRPRPKAVVVSPEALELHREAFVIDLHVDSLLWPRDLLETGRGQVDFPRMREGGLDAAAFTIATRFFGLGGLKAFHDLWPPATWVSPWARFRHQVQKLDRFVAQSNGRVRRATRAAELDENHRQGVISVFHGLEGAHALGTDVSRVREAAALGVLFISPVHLSNNAYGGSSSGTNVGLTPLGRALILEMNLAGVMVDLAHASARGGVIGQMLTPPALSSPDLGEALRHLTHFIDVAGEDAVALGSDFDGYVTSPIDVTGIPELTELMLRAGWSETRIEKVLGGNVLRLLERREAALK